MSQIRLTKNERVEALGRLGFNEREAEFLSLAALHGGYFLRRQYCQFLGQGAGGTAAGLIEKLLAKGYAQATTFAAGTHIYHLCSRPFYAALGQENNRNRRLRQPATIKNKLMGLGFVLAHLEHEYLATEQEKLDYFTRTLALDRSLLPAKHYAGQGQLSDRYFVEKFPLFLAAQAPPVAPPMVSFCFIDEGQATLSRFSNFLQTYVALLAHLPEFQVIFVAATDVHFEAAADAFGRFSQQALAPQNGTPVGSGLARLQEHFEARQLSEAQQWNAFDRAKLIRFRNERQEFSGEQFEALYRRWKAGGAAALKGVLAPKTGAAASAHRTFLTCRLEENYDLFGSITTY